MTDQADMLPGAEDPRSLIGRDLGDIAQHKWAPLLAEIYDSVEAAFRRGGHDEAGAAKLASTAVAAVAFSIGGRVVYIPRGDRLKTALRDNEIHSRWQRGAVPEQLAEEYEVSVIQLYRIIAEQRKLHLAKTQGRLFDNQGS